MPTTDPPKPKPTIVKKPWENGLGPYYIGLFLWVVYFDQIGLRALQVGGLGWSFLGVVVGGLMCYLLLYRVPAQWGFATGKPLPELAASTFGVSGARWVPGLLLGLAEVVWFAVAVGYATDLTLRGLAEVRFFDERALRPITIGSLRLKGPLYLSTAFFWSIMAGLVGRWFVRLVVAIMYVFPIFPAMVLGGVMMAMLGGLRWFEPTGVDPLGIIAVPYGRQGVWSMMQIIQLIFGFFAMAGAYAADWGAASTTGRDVRVGGLVAAGLAPIVIATISLVAVAGYLGRLNAPPPGSEAVAGPDFASDPTFYRNRGNVSSSSSVIRSTGREIPEASFRAVMTDGIGGKVGCGMLLILGVSSMAPAVFSAFAFGNRLNASLPRLSRTRWTLVGIAVSWPLLALGIGDRLGAVFTMMGALFAPLVGCLTAESLRHKGVWPGARRGVNWPGIVGWSLGVAVGLLPFAGGRFVMFQPAAFWAFVTSLAVYWVAALVIGEAGPVEPEKAVAIDPAG
jgi:cytosine permease